MRLDVSKQYGYEIAAALRGPDFPRGFVFKDVFTCRIRVLVGVSTGIPAALRYNRIGDWEVSKLREVCRKSLPDGAHHYLSHIMRATHALKDLDLEELAEIVAEGRLGDYTDVQIIDLAGGE